MTTTDHAAVHTTHTDNRAGGEPDQLIGVAAAELGEWGWLAGALLDWLAAATDDTVTDFGRFFAPGPTREHGLDQLHHLAERIDGLLERNRGPR
jgi:hypothetical protein